MAFRIHGMDCAEEVAVLKSEVGPLVGGEDCLAFDVLRGKMIVTGTDPLIDDDFVIDAVGRTGMTAETWRDNPDEAERTAWQRWGRSVLTATSGLLTLAAFITHSVDVGNLASALGSEGMGVAHSVPVVARLLYSMAIFAGVWFVIPKAWHAIRRVRPDMNLLMTVAVIGAIVIGEWLEAATVAFLFSVSLLLESWSVSRARRAVEALLDLAPPTARLKDGDTTRDVPPDEVDVGSVIVVQSGERFPLDGTIVDGSGQVNQAPITGESVPVDKEPGDDVFAGTVNGDATLEIETTKPASDTTLAKIIRLVGEAQSRRSPSEQWVEKFARYYTPIVMAVALLLFVVPPLLFSESWSIWFYRSLVLLVIACPCALVISTPVSIVAALAASARNGVLVKGGIYMEAPARLRAIAMDKTGTITRGEPVVQKIVPLADHDERELLERAGAMEIHSTHPIAKAIIRYCHELGVFIKPASDFRVVQGRGAVAKIDGKIFWLGSHRYLEERDQETPQIHEQLQAMSDAGHTVVVIGNGDHVCGLISVADAVRPESKRTIQSMHDAGIEHIIMLTGDNEGTAKAIAAESGVDEAMAELLPHDKVDAIERLVEKYGHVAMIGDGINDAPALARATLGIAMGAAGTDAAIEAADIALMSDDLSKIPWLIRHSRHTLNIIRQNIALALGIKAAFVILAIAGLASLWAAIAADMGASLLVTFNGLRLLGNRSIDDESTTT